MDNEVAKPETVKRWQVKCPCGSFLPRPKGEQEFIECKKCGNHYHADDVHYPRPA